MDYDKLVIRFRVVQFADNSARYLGPEFPTEEAAKWWLQSTLAEASACGEEPPSGSKFEVWAIA